MDRTVIVEPGQTLEDIALQEYGAVDGVTWLLLDNEDQLPNGYSTALLAGTELRLREATHADAEMYATMRKLRIVPATAPTDVETMLVTEEGDHNDDHSEDHY